MLCDFSSLVAVDLLIFLRANSVGNSVLTTAFGGKCIQPSSKSCYCVTLRALKSAYKLWRKFSSSSPTVRFLSPLAFFKSPVKDAEGKHETLKVLPSYFYKNHFPWRKIRCAHWKSSHEKFLPNIQSTVSFSFHFWASHRVIFVKRLR